MADIPVLQADRETAADMVLANLEASHGGRQAWMVEAVASIRRGEQDDHRHVQALARHRHDHTADLLAVLDNCPLPSSMGTAAEHYQRFYDWYNGPVALALSRARNTPDLEKDNG